MLNIRDRLLFCGDFHTHWYSDSRNPALFLALLNHFDVDFVVLQAQGIEWQCRLFDGLAAQHGSGIRFFRGAELQFERWHLALWRNEEPLRLPRGLSATAALERLRPLAHLITFAHPADADLPLVRELFEKGLIDAVQWPDPGKAEGAPAWYRQCVAEEVRIPVVAGMDIHYPHGAYQGETVFYQGDLDPLSHVVSQPMLTWVEAEACEEQALLAAVRAGRSVAMNLRTGQLSGPEDLCRDLAASGALDELARRRTARRAWRLNPQDAWGRRLRLALPDFQEPVLAGVPGDDGKPVAVEARHGGDLRLPAPLLSGGADAAFQTVRLEAAGQRKLFAVRCSWPLAVRLVPRVFNEGAGYACRLEVEVRNLSGDALSGTVHLEGALWPAAPQRALAALPAGAVQTFEVEVPSPAQPCVETPVRIRVRLADGSTLTAEQEVAFAAVLYCGGRSPWAEHAFTLPMDRPDRVVAPLGNYDGPADISARVTLWWDETAFYLYAVTLDDVFHHTTLAPAVLGNRYAGSELFLNDSIELGIDPRHTKDLSLGRVYNFNLGIDSTGARRVIYFARPTLKPGPVTLGGWCDDCYPRRGHVDVERDEPGGRTVYRLTMPWEDLAPLSPLDRRPFGFSIMINDNDGEGWGCKQIYWGGNTGNKKPLAWASVSFVE